MFSWWQYPASLPRRDGPQRKRSRRAVRRILLDAKQEVAQQRAVDAVVPRGRHARPRGAPHVACDLHVLLVVDMQMLELPDRER
jgi:hypothetical protein